MADDMAPEIKVEIPASRKKRGGARPGAGRPKGFREMSSHHARMMVSNYAKEHTKEAVDVLRAIMKGGRNESARVAAANSILDRGWGKPAQAVEVTASGSIALEVQHAVTIEQLSAEERALLRQLLESRLAAKALPVIDVREEDGPGEQIGSADRATRRP
jgi:hypothetical protein